MHCYIVVSQIDTAWTTLTHHTSKHTMDHQGEPQPGDLQQQQGDPQSVDLQQQSESQPGEVQQLQGEPQPGEVQQQQQQGEPQPGEVQQQPQTTPTSQIVVSRGVMFSAG